MKNGSASCADAGEDCRISLPCSYPPEDQAQSQDVQPSRVDLLLQKQVMRDAERRQRMTKKEIQAAFRANYFKVEEDLERQRGAAPILEHILEKKKKHAKGK